MTTCKSLIVCIFTWLVCNSKTIPTTLSTKGTTTIKPTNTTNTTITTTRNYNATTLTTTTQKVTTTTPLPTTSFINYRHGKVSELRRYQMTTSTVTLGSKFDHFTWQGDCGQFNAVKVNDSCECRMKATSYWNDNLLGYFLAHPITHRYTCMYERLPVISFPINVSTNTTIPMVEISQDTELINNSKIVIREVARETYDQRNPLVKEQKIGFEFRKKNNISFLVLLNSSKYEPGNTFHMVVEKKPNDLTFVYVRLLGSKKYSIATQQTNENDTDTDRATLAVMIVFVVCFAFVIGILGVMIFKNRKLRQAPNYVVNMKSQKSENTPKRITTLPPYVVSELKNKSNKADDDYQYALNNDNVPNNRGYEAITRNADPRFEPADAAGYEISPSEVYDMKENMARKQNIKVNRKQPIKIPTEATYQNGNEIYENI